MDQVGERLAELRARRVLTLRDLAERSGVAPDTINQIELGHRKARPSTLRKLAHALGVDVEEFYREPALAGKAEAPETGQTMAEFLQERCGHAYLAQDAEHIKQILRTTAPQFLDKPMCELRKELDALIEERKKYPALGRWQWDEELTDITWKYLTARSVGYLRTPEEKESLLEQARELEGRGITEGKPEAG